MKTYEFNMNGEKINATIENTHIYLFKEDVFDHLTIRQEKAGMLLSYLIFRADIDNFDEVSMAMAEDEFTYTCAKTPTTAVEDKFRDRFVKNIDVFPVEWLLVK